MKKFAGKIAVVTGGGSGMGRELVLQLAAEGCNVAFCDLSEPEMKETRELAQGNSPDVRITTHICDVSDEAAILGFRDEVAKQHETDHIHLLFNNAGLSGGGSLYTDSREAWDRCFNICWGGVYYGTRAFLPMLTAADSAHLINTSSVNGFWASLGPDRPHTSYSAAKFAVKGFTEALITDLRCNAPHVKVSLVMPGHIGTSIVENSMRHGRDEVDSGTTAMMQNLSKEFRERAPMTAAQAATVILDGVREERWRILVGDDARALDAAVRKDPELAYEGKAFQDVLVGEDSTLFDREKKND
jgi:NAD(P)-dependent dehydrogenase (short-subunit alcohol dehydrogenase family)